VLVASSLQQGLSQQVPSQPQTPVSQQQPLSGQPSAQHAQVQPQVSTFAVPATAQGPTARAKSATTANTAEIEIKERNMVLNLSDWKI